MKERHHRPTDVRTDHVNGTVGKVDDTAHAVNLRNADSGEGVQVAQNEAVNDMIQHWQFPFVFWLRSGKGERLREHFTWEPPVTVGFYSGCQISNLPLRTTIVMNVGFLMRRSGPKGFEPCWTV